MVSEGEVGRRVRVSAERDPGVASRVLERFANLNVIPLRFSAKCEAENEIIIEIEIACMSCATLALIAGKIAQLPAVLNVVLDDLQ
jgi:(p)ppGpp synthase/HD superfamily hydrolase